MKEVASMKKRFLSLLLVLCMMISLSVVPVSAASPKVYDKMSDSYKSGPYYQKLMNVNLTGDQITDLINVARSQVGYHSGGSKTDLSGTSTSGKKYVEYFNLISPSTMPADWCATFVTWCFREAGIPTSIMPNATGCGKIRNTGGKNKDKYSAVYHSLESGYKPKKGDIVLYEHLAGSSDNHYYEPAPRDANGVPTTSSHVGIVSGDYNSSTNTFKTIQRKSTVVKEYDEDLNVLGKGKNGTKIKKIQGFITPAYNGKKAASTPILTMYYNVNGGVIQSDTYSQTSDGRIQKKGIDVTSKWECGSGDPTYGLWDAATFGLTRSGYKISGWSLSRDGSSTVFGQNDLNLRAEHIYPYVKEGDATVTLYAVWNAEEDIDELIKNGIPVTVKPIAGLEDPVSDSDEFLDEDMTGASDDELTTDDVEALIQADMDSAEEPAEEPASLTEPEPEPEEASEEEPAPETTPEPEPEPEEEPASKSTIVMKIDDPFMTVNGKVTPVDELGNTPIIRNSRTMLPIASLMLAMDGTVGWDGSTKTVTLKRNGKTMFLRIGTSFAWDENGLAVAQLDSPPIIINGRTMLPVAAVVLYFGAEIKWDGTARTVTITY